MVEDVGTTTFREAVLRAAFSALIDDDASEEDCVALADELAGAWPPEIPAASLDGQRAKMDPDLRDALQGEGLPDDQIFLTAYALAHSVKFGQPFRCD